MLLFVLVLGFVSYEHTRRIHTQINLLATHPLQVRRAIGEIKFGVATLNNQVQLLLLRPTDETLAKAVQEQRQGRSAVTEQLDILYSQYLGSRADVDSIRSQLIAYFDLHDQFFRLNTVGESAKETMVTSFIEMERLTFNRLLNAIGVVDRFAKNKTDTLLQNSEDLRLSLIRQLIILVLIIIVLSILIISLLMHSILNPVEIITQMARFFQQGKMSVRSSYESKSELGELAVAFNAMAESIESGSELASRASRVSERMLTEDDARKFFSGTMQILMEYTGSSLAVVYVLSIDKKRYEHFESIGTDVAVRQSFPADAPIGEFGLAITSRKYQIINNIPESTRFLFTTASGSFVPRNMIVMPVASGEEVVALISLGSLYEFTQSSMALIESIYGVLSARIQGVLNNMFIRQLARQLEDQNRELEMQQNEMSAQSVELTQQNRELEAQKARLDEANRLKTNFLSNMSHELRTPLNSVIALTGVLSRRLARQIPEEEHGYLEVIERNGKHLLSLINDILDISRIESGHEDIEVTEFYVCEVINHVMGLIGPQATEKGLEFPPVSGDCHVRIRTDLNKLSHIMQNLIGNAVKFSETGGISVEVKATDQLVSIRVADTGIGISEEHLPHIFEEFRQADSGVSRRFGGTGLGLAIAKKYAELLGGTITVQSEMGKGTEFVVTLPLEFGGTAEIPAFSTEVVAEPGRYERPGPIHPSDVTKTVMLVEDSEPAIVQMKDILEGKGYKILVARGGEAALDAFATMIPDAIILDLMMPGIDGFQVLESIRNDDRTARVPVLILTAKHMTKEDLKELKRNNIHQLIQKGDVNRDELLMAVSSMVTVKTEKSERLRVPGPAIREHPLVLVVEDNPDNMTTVKAILSDQFRIIEAVDGKEAVRKATANKPDLILMDIALPEMDGITAFTLIRKNGTLAHVPVIALTASALTEDREAILAHGFDAYVSKPIDIPMFVKTINAILYGK